MESIEFDRDDAPSPYNGHAKDSSPDRDDPVPRRRFIPSPVLTQVASPEPFAGTAPPVPARVDAADVLHPQIVWVLLLLRNMSPSQKARMHWI